MYDELYHYGVKGMKWGVRRYQNKDGSYTDLGKRRNLKALQKVEKKERNRLGGAVGKDPIITSAADRVRDVQIRRNKALNREYSILDKMEIEMLEKLDKHYDEMMNSSDPSEKYDTIEKEITSKYKKELDAAKKETAKVDAEFRKAVKQTVDDFLGEYGDTPVKDYNGVKLDAAKRLAMQIEWGNNIREDY